MQEEIIMTPERALVGMIVLTAIPVVMFSLWGEYFKAQVDELKQGSGNSIDFDDEGEEFDQRAEMNRVRMAGILTTVFQVMVFFAAQPLREYHQVWGIVIPLLGLFIQGQVQFSLEKKVRGLEAGHSDQNGLLVRTMLWSGAAGLLYGAVVMASVVGSFLLAQALGAPKGLMLAAMLTGTLGGVAAGLLVNFALAPFFVRKMLPTEPLENGRVVSMVEACFGKAGLPVPSLWVIRLDKFRFGNALVAGFTRGKGIFAPGLFISSSLISELEHEELEAVIAHEVSHLALHHLRKRFVATLSLSAIVCALVGTLVFSAYLFASPEAGRLAGPVGAFAAFVAVFWMMKRQNARHECEADLHAVTVMGARLESFASALRKLDRMNDQFSDQTQITASHPATEERIRLLREALGTGAEELRDDRAA